MLASPIPRRHNKWLADRVRSALAQFPGKVEEAADFADAVPPRPMVWRDVAFCQLVTVNFDGNPVKALLIIREKENLESHECAHCSARIDPARPDIAFAGDVLFGEGDVVPLDGIYCREDCAIEAAETTTIESATSPAEGRA